MCASRWRRCAPRRRSCGNARSPRNCGPTLAERRPSRRGKTVAAGGSQIDTWENNLPTETSIRYGGYGGIACRYVSNTCIALFSRFIP
ncbi:Tn3 family transposase [Streptosporangium longisporum]|uniref:Tn3 family transposase n=1 Tax=Streptosporangium longisporum TaxID=46187 RepID=UPI0031F0BA63